MVSIAYLSPIAPGQWGADKWVGFGGVLLYGVAIYIATRKTRQPSVDSLPVRYSALVVAALSLLLMILASPRDIIFILTIIFASILPEYFPLRRSAVIQLALHCTLALVYMQRWGATSDFFFESLLWLAFEAFALLSSQIAADERRARQDLEFSHAQLEATQSMLAAASRQDERLRISRDIHDVLGHHLTGLSLQLEVASHSTAQKVQEHITQAQFIAKLLLSDVRQVVNDLRQIDQMDLADALRSLAANTGRLQIDLTIPDQLTVPDTRVAEAVFRTVQEIVTNAVRHSSASGLYINLADHDGTLTITASDDGHIDRLPPEGNGLKGMRERIEDLGGSVQLGIARGLSYTIQLGSLAR